MRTKNSRLKVKWLKNGGVSLYYKGKRQFTGSYESARHFSIGFKSPIDLRDVPPAIGAGA